MKAVAAANQVHLRDHRELTRYAAALVQETRAPELQAAFATAQMLHSNYYEVFLDREQMEHEAAAVIPAVTRLLATTPEAER